MKTENKQALKGLLLIVLAIVCTIGIPTYQLSRLQKKYNTENVELEMLYNPLNYSLLCGKSLHFKVNTSKTKYVCTNIFYDLEK